VISVLDTCAMLAYLIGESGAEVVKAIIENPISPCYAHSVNLCEVYYQIVRKSDETEARLRINGLLADGVIERSDMGRTFWERVGSHKARGRISLADCFCIALAREISGQVVTSDHHEFDPLVPLGICPILFIR
jgi:predicted nucleic acid-binding protein